MPKPNKKTVLLDKFDKYRCLLSETTPSELPIIISNDGFYRNVKEFTSYTDKAREFLDNVLIPTEKGKNPTLPLYYRIVKDLNSTRRLGLVHPRVQLEICDFYDKYKDLITLYCGRSEFSIRSPKQVAGRYYVTNKFEDMHAEKTELIMTLGDENISKNPASYFAYKGFHRLFKFFNSRLYNYLERKFPCMCIMDISNCFDSIYTHSISWATKSKRESKSHTQSETFGASFDHLMQIMNYNETNGIVIGPEVCRIFAEILLSRVDFDLQSNIEKKDGIVFKKDYAIARYVDNYYIFYSSEEKFNLIKEELLERLQDYKLHINDRKTEIIKRPFFTKKSMAISEINYLIKEKIESIIDFKSIRGRKISYPKRIVSQSSIFSTFTLSLRRSCFLSGVGYEEITNYLIAALRRRLINLLNDGKIIKELSISERKSVDIMQDVNDEDKLYEDIISFLLEAVFHTFSLCPTVSSSLEVSGMLVKTAEFTKNHAIKSFYLIRERVQLWTSALFDSQPFSNAPSGKYISAVEILNILCALKSFDFDGIYFKDSIEKCKKFDGMSKYFETVCKLYIYGSDARCGSLRDDLINQAIEFLDETKSVAENSEALHLCLDLLSCPYISIQQRRAVYNKSIEMHNKSKYGMSIAKPQNNAEIDSALTQFTGRPWFVEWDHINLMRMIEKKRLKKTYQ